MTNKNPFEIRAEMLQLAKDYMDQQYHMNIQFGERMIEEGEKSRKDIEEQLKEAYKMYGMEELMEKDAKSYRSPVGLFKWLVALLGAVAAGKGHVAAGDIGAYLLPTE